MCPPQASLPYLAARDTTFHRWEHVAVNWLRCPFSRLYLAPRPGSAASCPVTEIAPAALFSIFTLNHSLKSHHSSAFPGLAAALSQCEFQGRGPCSMCSGKSLEPLMVVTQGTLPTQSAPALGSTTRGSSYRARSPRTAPSAGGQRPVLSNASCLVKGNYVSEETMKGYFVYTPPNNYCRLAIAHTVP